MSTVLELIKTFVGVSGTPHYVPYNIKDTQIVYGVPAVGITGLHYIFARHNQPQNKRFGCLTGGGFFASNLNTSGIIEIGLLEGSASCAVFQIQAMTGIAYPLVATDTSTAGTSLISCDACRLVGTPEWRRERTVGLSVFTFEAKRLGISLGMRKIEPD